MYGHSSSKQFFRLSYLILVVWFVIMFKHNLNDFHFSIYFISQGFDSYKFIGNSRSRALFVFHVGSITISSFLWNVFIILYFNIKKEDFIFRNIYVGKDFLPMVDLRSLWLLSVVTSIHLIIKWLNLCFWSLVRMTDAIFFFLLSVKKAVWNHISPNKQQEPFLLDFENTTSKLWY